MSAAATPLFSFKVDTSQVETVVRGMPKVAYFWLRDYVKGALIDHRVGWLQAKGTKFGRGGRGIKVHRIDEGPASPGPREVTYRVHPREKRQPTAEQASAALGSILAETFTGNEVLPVHEAGGEIRARRARYMPLPMRGTKPGTIAKFRATHPGSVLVTRPIGHGRLLVFEVSSRRGSFRAFRKANPGAYGPAAPKRTWTLRFLLLNRVDMKPTLRYYSTWDGLGSTRDEKFRRVADRMIEDMAKGDPRDK